jgi:nucleotide-binding universal stress UspA family protein
MLCGVDFSSHSPKTIRWAQNLATEVSAQLTVAHVTPGVEIYGPDGYHVITEMKRQSVEGATAQIAKPQQEQGTKAEVFIASGDIPKVMGLAVKETKADLVVVGCRSLDSRFGSAGYGIISEAHVPVLSV